MTLFDIIGMQEGRIASRPVLVRILLGRRASLWESHCVAREFSALGKMTTYVIGPNFQLTIYASGQLIRGHSPLRLIPPGAERGRQGILPRMEATA